MKARSVKIISFILSVCLIAWLISLIDTDQLLTSIRHMDMSMYLMALLFYFLTYAVRALRLWLLFGKKQYERLLVFTSVHQVLNRVMPFRTGEIFFPLLIKTLTNNAYSKGVPGLIVIRILDLISLVASFLALSLFINLDMSPRGKALALGVLALLVGILLSLRYTVPMGIRLMGKLAPANYRNRIGAFAQNTREAFNISFVSYILLTTLSIVDKLLNYVMCFFVIRGLGYDFSLMQIVSANSLSGITEVLPVNSLGSFGTTELGWAGAMIYFGVDKGTAIASGFGFNIMAFTFTVLLGLAGYLVIIARYKTNLFSLKYQNPTTPNI